MQEWFPIIHSKRCTGCRTCVETCPVQALEQRNGKAVLAYPDQCTYCAACESICPADAIELPYLVCKEEK
jgi:NAD-dependent dihydropyrimidine dehydrogenase PreA subunit